jgi:hypothetical protein
MEKYKQTTLCIIYQQRATESDYGLITKDNKPLEFETEQGGARKWASANIEAKKRYDCKLVYKSRSNADK